MYIIWLNEKLIVSLQCSKILILKFTTMIEERFIGKSFSSMSKKDIEDGNATILEFMGYHLNYTSEDGYRVYTNSDKSTCVNLDENSYIRTPMQDMHILNVKFDRDWNWIMQVVDRIESIEVAPDCRHKGYEFCLHGKICAFIINPSTGNNVGCVDFCDFDDNDSIPISNLEATWCLCYMFANWYKGQNV